jgi:diaminobutyrate-2-oxoglutarate transaminase
MSHEAVFQELESAVRSYCRDTPNLFVSARGARIWDADGVEFIDFLSGCGSLNYGHNHPALKLAAINYLIRDGVGNALDFHTDAKLAFLMRFKEVILAPRRLPHLLQFTGPTGANCVEAALKLARKFTGRSNVVAFTNAFHGMSTGALAVTGSRLARSASEAVLGNVTRLAFDGYHDAGAAELERFAEMARDPSGGIDPVAAFIVETVQGEGGLNVASTAWLRKLRSIASDLGALLIIDDIQAGCGRTGNFFSFEHAQIMPDLICLSKSLSGFGLPMSVLLVAPNFDCWRPAEHNGTFRGNSLAFVTATAALDFWDNSDFPASIAIRSKVLNAWIGETVKRFPTLISRGKGTGMMAGIEFGSPRDAQMVSELARGLRVLIERCGPHDEVVKVFAPINIDCALFSEGLGRLTSAIEKVSLTARSTAQPVAA